MHFRTLVITALAALVPFSTVMGDDGDPVNFHLSFDDLSFMEREDFVHRSGLKTIEDRGIVTADGKFGKGVMTSIPTRIDSLDEMTGTDLDHVTAVVFTTRSRRDQWDVHNVPVMWGAGKLTPESGSVAFWLKGGIDEGCLFSQYAMAWGRKEKYLLSITTDENDNLGAYLVDSRYVRHEIASEVRWETDRWNHVVLNWDKANGLELFINGTSAASSWGDDSWWMTALPGLFTFPATRAVYDEFYIFSRPLKSGEIEALITENNPPRNTGASYARTPAERDRLADAWGLTFSLALPKVSPSPGAQALNFREITPERFGDGHVPGRFCMDGRYELAWPHPVATFTIIPGDADFQAEKLDVAAPAGTPYNYVTIEGNLNGMSVALTDAEKRDDKYTGRSFFSIHQDNRFFFGTTLDRAEHPMFTLPFLKGYGAPGEFEGDVRLPLTGETRVHEVGIFDVTLTAVPPVPGESIYYLGDGEKMPFRYDFVLKTMNPPADRVLFTATETPGGTGAWRSTGYVSRVHFATAPMTEERCIGSILLDIPVRTRGDQDLLAVRLHDPSTPHRIWTHAEVNLRGFDGDGGRLKLLLDAPPLILAKGDVVWLDITTYNGADILVGGNDTGRIVLKPASRAESETAFEKKALMPTMAEFTKAYHHRPWTFEDMWPDIDNPHSFGGQFDSIMPALAVRRILPDSRLAEFYIAWGGPKYYWGSFTDPEKNFPIKDIPVPGGVPRWAHLQHIIQDLRYRIVDYLVENQNPDGQLWGGWNDDTLILRGRPDIALDGYTGARDLFLKVYEGLDKTNIFGGGFCQIRPIDNVHNGDFVRERYRALIFKPGDPYIYLRALQTAWHWDKPDRTPYNWGGGQPFLFDKRILEWYWGENTPDKAYETIDGATLDKNLSRLASYCDDNLYYRFTDARVHTDASSIYNEHYVCRMIVGGNVDESISVAWPEGGGKDLARWVTYADSAKLSCRMFSFDGNAREVTARLFRIGYGTYEITVNRDIDGQQGDELFSERKKLMRFDTITFPVPPKEPVILTVRQVKRHKIKPELPDLAVAAYECERHTNTLSIRVMNLGDGASKKTKVRVYNDQGEKIGEAKVPGIEPPTDFVFKSTWVDIDNLPRTGKLTVEVDPGDKQREIFEENNIAVVE